MNSLVTSIFFNLASRLAFLLFSHAETAESFFCALLKNYQTNISVISSYHDLNSDVIQQKIEFYDSLELKSSSPI